MGIEFLHRKDIDTGRWDELIAESQCETLYPYSWYLDTVASRWSALVVDDYNFVMPVVWKQKYGMKFIYQPYYTQQLGVFSKEYVDPTLIRELLSLLYRKYRFGNLNFNTKNLVSEDENISVYDKSNYVLGLAGNYEELYARFSKNAKRNIKRSHDYNEEIVKDASCEEVLAFKRENDLIKRSEGEYRWLLNLMETIRKNNAGIVYAIRDSGRIIASAFFAFSRTRGIYLVSASNEQGKEQRSMFKIVDAFIREHAGSDLILDFEGSNIPSVARFFAGFGARPEIYQGINFDRLPVFLNKLRKHD
ncbi:MAG: hypothetical protein ABFS28_00560 [Bacteroidota bacterium]